MAEVALSCYIGLDKLLHLPAHLPSCALSACLHLPPCTLQAFAVLGASNTIITLLKWL